MWINYYYAILSLMPIIIITIKIEIKKFRNEHKKMQLHVCGIFNFPRLSSHHHCWNLSACCGLPKSEKLLIGYLNRKWSHTRNRGNKKWEEYWTWRVFLVLMTIDKGASDLEKWKNVRHPMTFWYLVSSFRFIYSSIVPAASVMFTQKLILRLFGLKSRI